MNQLKWWQGLLIMLVLTSYPIIELTRMIILEELIMRIYPEVPIYQFITELIVMWILYLVGMLIVAILFRDYKD